VPAKSYIVYFLLFLIAVVFFHNATLHSHLPEVSEQSGHQHHQHHHHHQDGHDLWAWLIHLLHDWQHTDLGERHFEDFRLNPRFEKVVHPIIDIIAPALFIPADTPSTYAAKADFFYSSAFIEPPPEGSSSPRAPPSFS
jgi:hypothetical protein